MRRTLIILSVAFLMTAMFVVVPAAPASPPSGGGGTGCVAGQMNAYLAIGYASPSGEQQGSVSGQSGDSGRGQWSNPRIRHRRTKHPGRGDNQLSFIAQHRAWAQP